VVTHLLQVEHRTGKACRPKTDVIPLCHATKQVICLEQGANDLHMVQQMPLRSATPSFLPLLKSTMVYPFGAGLPFCPGKEALK